MTFLSYAQNLEDVVLRRALMDIDKGFYIDIGACSPDDDSVTRAFYEMGWQGINVEPNITYYQQLEHKRDKDINLHCAAGDKSGRLQLTVFDGTGLSTLEPSIADKHINNFESVKKYDVDVLTLETIWAKHVPEKQDVHFLKIDVEGFEKQVLSGLDWQRNRAWIIVIESVEPMHITDTSNPIEQKFNFDVWQDILINNDYVYAYCDGLNRFYVSLEKRQLLDSFLYPPNVFDNFKLECQNRLELSLAHNSDKLVELDKKNKSLESNQEKINREKSTLLERVRELDDLLTNTKIRLEKQAAEHDEYKRLILNSWSWRITRPVRYIINKLRLLVKNS